MKYLLLMLLAAAVLLACGPEPEQPVQIRCRPYVDAQGNRTENCFPVPTPLPKGWEKMASSVVDVLSESEEDPLAVYDDEALVVSYRGREEARAIRAWLGKRGFANDFQPGDPGIRAWVPLRSIPDLAKLEEVERIYLTRNFQRFHPPAAPPRQDYSKWCLEPSPDCTPDDVVVGIAMRGSGDPLKFDIRVVPHQGQRDSLVAWLESLGYSMKESAYGTTQQGFIVRTTDLPLFEQLAERDEVDWLGGIESPEPVWVTGLP